MRPQSVAPVSRSRLDSRRRQYRRTLGFLRWSAVGSRPRRRGDHPELPPRSAGLVPPSRPFRRRRSRCFRELRHSRPCARTHLDPRSRRRIRRRSGSRRGVRRIRRRHQHREPPRLALCRKPLPRRHYAERQHGQRLGSTGDELHRRRRARDAFSASEMLLKVIRRSRVDCDRPAHGPSPTPCP